MGGILVIHWSQRRPIFDHQKWGLYYFSIIFAFFEFSFIVFWASPSLWCRSAGPILLRSGLSGGASSTPKQVYILAKSVAQLTKKTCQIETPKILEKWWPQFEAPRLAKKKAICNSFWPFCLQGVFLGYFLGGSTDHCFWMLWTSAGVPFEAIIRPLPRSLWGSIGVVAWSTPFG